MKTLRPSRVDGRRLVALLAVVTACAPILADGFREKLAAGCRSLAECQALHTEAIARSSRCQREYSASACAAARDDEQAAYSLVLHEHRIQAQLDEWKAQQEAREQLESLLAAEQAQAKQEAEEREAREALARKAHEDSERAQAEAQANEEAERARKLQEAPAATTETPDEPDSSWEPAPQECCRICHKGKACGNSCISRSKTCHKGPGCACDG